MREVSGDQPLAELCVRKLFWKELDPIQAVEMKEKRKYETYANIAVICAALIVITGLFYYDIWRQETVWEHLTGLDSRTLLAWLGLFLGLESLATVVFATAYFEARGGRTGFVCPRCGAPVEFEQAYCSKCGEKIDWQRFRCPECGQEVDRDAESYCPKCGARLS